ncbi:hypothetical protein P3X46_011777 [Hevea brasiliensis]|uniref:glutathione gamma-glutamylcysteinyltransferase n=1 Tax=Hevea brasiliensis TaxID=3981 RepID=A0ABQ9MC31_HEVBR|nr:hypothetical protein P3X46_011777 [Hevea brasiliensis]
MAMAGLYRRLLPSPPATNFASSEGKVCCEQLEKVKAKGISFGKLVCLAHYRDWSFFTDWWTGHFSPIGGYHAGRDMALILDVARFKYPPHWVPLTLLWEAMNNIDETTGKNKGFIFKLRSHPESGLLYSLSCKRETWAAIAKYLVDDIPILLKSEDVKDIRKLLLCCFLEGVLKQVQETGLFKNVAGFLSSANSCCKSVPILSLEDDLPRIAAGICAKGQRFWQESSVLQDFIVGKLLLKRCQENKVDGDLGAPLSWYASNFHVNSLFL